MQFILVAALAALAVAAPVEKRGTDAPYGDKKGLAYNDDKLANALSKAGSATWAYNWAAGTGADRFQQIPMFWGPKGDTDGVMKLVKDTHAPYVLGYNEPDEIGGNGGCNLSPQAARGSWGGDMFKFEQAGAKLVCPAVTSFDTQNGHTGGPAGLTWLNDFVGNDPGGLHCSAQALHWYGTGGQSAQQQADAFKSYIADASKRVNGMFKKNVDLWITEFAPIPADNVKLMADFLSDVVPWLDQQDYVARYSPFKAETLASKQGNGYQINEAGNAFINSH